MTRQERELEVYDDIAVEMDTPDLFAVIMFNDDFTTMDFVVWVLMHIFQKSTEEASFLMLKIHNEGEAIVGKYVYDIALTKKNQTLQLAEEEGFPLQVTIKEIYE